MNAVLARQHESIFASIGHLLNLKVESEADLLRIGRQGITPKAFKRVATRLNLPTNLIGPATTIRRRLEANERFSQPESERLLRVVRVYAEASQFFGDEQATNRWMNTAAPFVQGQSAITPIELAASDSGARLLEASILRTAHGIF